MLDIVQILTTPEKRIEKYINHIINKSINNQKNIIYAKKVHRNYSFESLILRKSFTLFRTFYSDLLNLSIKYNFCDTGAEICLVISIPKILSGYTLLLNFYKKGNLLDDEKIAIQRYNENKLVFKNYIATGSFETYNNEEHRYVVFLDKEDIIYELNNNMKGTFFSIKLYKMIKNDVALMGSTDQNEMLNIIVLDE